MPIEGGSQHYKSGKVEPLELIEAQEIGFHLGNVIKYATRAWFYHKKEPKLVREAMDKAIWYCNRFKELYG